MAAADLNGDGIVDVFAAPGLDTGNPQSVICVDGTKLNDLQSNSQIADAALIFSIGIGNQGNFVGSS